MKKTLQVLLLLCFCLTTMAEEAKTHLIVWAKDGTKVAYALTEKPKITFTGTDLVITSNGIEVNYILENMDRFTYESNSSSSVTNIETGKPYFKFEGEMLLFPDLKANSTVSIYSLNGALMFTKTVQEKGEYAFSISSMNAGVYIVNVNGLTYKIVKR